MVRTHASGRSQKTLPFEVSSKLTIEEKRLDFWIFTLTVQVKGLIWTSTEGQYTRKGKELSVAVLPDNIFLFQDKIAENIISWHAV